MQNKPNQTQSQSWQGRVLLYIGVFWRTLDVLWSASEYLLMHADVRCRELMTSGDSGVSPTNSRCTQPALSVKRDDVYK